MLKPDSFEAITKNKAFRLIGVIIFVLFAAICILHTADVYAYRPLFTGRNSFEAAHAIKDCSSLNRVIAYGISVSACIGVMAITPHIKLKLITGIGERSLAVYMLHFVLLQACQLGGLMGLLGNVSGQGWLLLIPLGIVIAILTSIPPFQTPLRWLNGALMKQ